MATADSAPSPYEQIRQGIAINDIICNDEKILLESPRGKPVCVTSRTTERLLDKGYILVIQNKIMLTLNNTESTTPVIEQNNTESDVDPFYVSPLVIEQLRNNTKYNLKVESSTYMIMQTEGLPKAPNPTGDWVPIVDKDKYVAKLTAAANDKFIGIDKSGKYNTEKGLILLQNYTSPSRAPFVEVAYYLPDSSAGKDEQIAFVDNFMKNMGYKWGVGEDTLTTLKEWDQKCNVRGEKPPYRICNQFARVSFHDPDYSERGIGEYIIYQKFSNIHFKFHPSHNALHIPSRVEIYFDGWTNNPELVKFPLDREVALQKAYDFAYGNYELNRPLDHEEDHIFHCPFRLIKDNPEISDKHIKTKRILISGVPHYQFHLGYCDEYDYPGHLHTPNSVSEGPKPLIIVDAIVGESIFIAGKARI